MCKAEVVATKWAELRAMTGKSEAQDVLWKESYSVFVLGNLAQYCHSFAPVPFATIKYIVFSKSMKHMYFLTTQHL